MLGTFNIIGYVCDTFSQKFVDCRLKIIKFHWQFDKIFSNKKHFHSHFKLGLFKVHYELGGGEGGAGGDR